MAAARARVDKLARHVGAAPPPGRIGARGSASTCSGPGGCGGGSPSVPSAARLHGMGVWMDVMRDLEQLYEGDYEQTFEAPWSERAVSATAAHAHPSLARHALLSVMRPDRSVFAAAIVPLPPPPAPPVSSSRRLLDAASAAPAVVSAPLTRGGRLVGTLTATVGLVVSRPD